MFKNNFNYAIGISFALHLSLLAGLKINTITTPLNKRRLETTVRISPQKIERIFKNKDKDFSNLKTPPYLKGSLKGSEPKINKKITSLQNKPVILKTNEKEVFISKTPKEEQLKKNPAYMGYYRLIREKIRKNAFHFYNSSQTGEIMLSFIIHSDGTLIKVYLHKSQASNRSLEKIALKSVKNAAPFPAFPKDLKQFSRLKFNIYIQFKNN